MTFFCRNKWFLSKWRNNHTKVGAVAFYTNLLPIEDFLATIPNIPIRPSTTGLRLTLSSSPNFSESHPPRVSIAKQEQDQARQEGMRRRSLQSGAARFDTGNGEQLSNSQATCLAGAAWVLHCFSPFPVSNPTAPLCKRQVQW